MIANTNRQIVLAARPVGPPKETDFRLVEGAGAAAGRGRAAGADDLALPRPLHAAQDGHGPPLLPADPARRRDRGRRGQPGGGEPPPEIRGPATSSTTYTGWQDYAIAQGAGARRVDPALGPLSTAVGVLGMPGLTAYLGLVKVGRPAPGDTVVISAASGAVGAVAGQVAKIAGCRVVGIAGGAEKLCYLTQELGFDEAIDRHTGATCPALSPRPCPDGIDIYFENVRRADRRCDLSPSSLTAPAW